MLNLDDMDQVIKLLQQNNWDESVWVIFITFLVSGIILLCLINAKRAEKSAKKIES
jgi:hypothetical protein